MTNWINRPAKQINRRYEFVMECRETDWALVRRDNLVMHTGTYDSCVEELRTITGKDEFFFSANDNGVYYWTRE
jgi:hypothetical protein